MAGTVDPIDCKIHPTLFVSDCDKSFHIPKIKVVFFQTLALSDLKSPIELKWVRNERKNC